MRTFHVATFSPEFSVLFFCVSGDKSHVSSVSLLFSFCTQHLLRSPLLCFDSLGCFLPFSSAALTPDCRGRRLWGSE